MGARHRFWKMMDIFYSGSEEGLDDIDTYTGKWCLFIWTLFYSATCDRANLCSRPNCVNMLIYFGPSCPLCRRPFIALHVFNYVAHNNSCTVHNTHALRALIFCLSILPELLLVRFILLLQYRPVSKSKLLGIVVAELLQAGCPSCHPTISMKALKDAVLVQIMDIGRGQVTLSEKS